MAFRVSYWALPAPVRTSNGITYTSIHVDQGGVTGIEIFESGMIKVERGELPALLIFERAFGECVPEEKPKRKADAPKPAGATS